MNSSSAAMITAGGVWSYKTNIRKDNNLDHQGSSSVSRVLPGISFRGKNFMINPVSARFSFLNKGWAESYVHLHFTGHEYRSDLMYRRKKSLYAGAGARILFLDFNFLKDTISRSKGSIYRISLRKRSVLGKKYSLVSNVGAEFFDKKYTQYYFGVLDGEQTSSRPIYSPNDSMSYFLTLINNYSINDSLSLSLITKATLYSKEIDTSPTVRKDEEYSVILGFFQRF